MTEHPWRRLTLLLILLMSVDALAQQTGPLPPITLSSQSIHPGDVLRVEIGVEDETRPVTGTFLGKQLALAYSPERRVWDGLIGVDLDTKPGTYRLRVETGGGEAVIESLRVLPKTFSVRRLRVAESFVNPPSDALDRIGQEAKTLQHLFGLVTPRRWTGTFLLPVDGTPTSNFGTRSIYNGEPRSPHAGIDFPGEPGRPVRAANHGIVALAEPLYFTGNTVVVDHGGGLYSLFAHLSEFRVMFGETVTPETIVGLVGATGRVTGPHLHWSVRLQGARVDPLSLVAATR